jgi:hypothetical protein
LQALRTRVRELKQAGRSVEEAAQSLTAEFRTKYPDWTSPDRVTAAVRTMYKEL